VAGEDAPELRRFWATRVPHIPCVGAKLNPNTGEYELPRKLQKSQQNGEAEGEGEGKEPLDEGESEPVSLMSDTEWEGWRRELDLEGPTRPSSLGLKVAQDVVRGLPRVRNSHM